jgi:hypothetical protein
MTYVSMKCLCFKNITKWKIHFGNGHRLPFVIGKAPVAGQVLQMSKKGNGQMTITNNTYS